MILSAFLSFLGSMLPSILYNVEKKLFIWVGLSGMCGFVIYSVMYQVTGKAVLSTFVGAVAVGLYSECIARILKQPATVFSVTGILPLVPGIGAYNTVRAVFDNKLQDAASIAVQTVVISGSIALGIMLCSAIFRIISSIGRRNRMNRI